ncbi:YXWGXW repeat-containing protein [Belnapia rosea]|uniref:YXWGXW repeat-containing protein n=1 Tax=Belnapia rosea TaxID=938405 RepID=UPI00087F5ECD|nr:YXWGXW repeat-containing protein [Belnapia rosea]SDB70536.1 YXWGXW repeat-containing protein [Belnapia rosea]
MLNRRRIAGLLAGLAAPVAHAGTASAQPFRPPPPLRLEPPPGRPPGPHLVWQPGHWVWTRRDYVWVPGQWVRARRGGWRHGHWDDRPRGRVWVPGGWR